MKNNIFKIALLSLGLVSLATTTSCSDDFVEREFEQNVIQGDLKNVQEVRSFVRGAYASMRAATYYGRDFMAYAEVRSDEMMSNGASGYFNTVRQYNMASTDAYARDTYAQIYTMIAKTNIVINTDLNTISGTAADKAAAKVEQGRAHALRALGFFDLLRLYGQKYIDAEGLGVVLPTKYDPKALMPRATIAETEAQIEADFNKALEYMGNSLTVKEELSTNAVKSLMTRFYLYKGDYAKVRSLVSTIPGSVIGTESYQNSFTYQMRGSAPNSIFELEVGTDSSLSTSSYNQIMSANGYRNLVTTAATLALYAPNDVRRNLITVSGTNHFLSAGGNGKYLNRTGADNIKMIRYEEILLNGAEAELQGGNPAKALEYYRMILANRLTSIPKLDVNGNPELDADGNVIMLTGEDQAKLITEVTLDMVKLERRKELLGEGFRMWDQLRWGDTSFVPATADKRKVAFPIPRVETDIAGTPVKSNPGYDN